jgi:hypothetical protein
MSQRSWIIALFILATALVACTVPGEPGTPGIELGEIDATPNGAVEPTSLPATDVPPTAEPPAPTEPPTAEPSATPEPVPTVLCPEALRPALLLFTGTAYELLNPLSEERCRIPLPADDIGPEFTAGDRIYFIQRDIEASSAVISRLNPDGTIEPLPATQAEGDVYYLMQFAAAPDESRLAWSQMRPQDDPNALGFLSTLWLAAADGSDAVTVFEDVIDGQNHIATPIRFSADGQTLFFTWQPIGLGGMWNAFNGRYDNLYRIPAAGGEPEKIFDCADLELFLCVGDFRDDGTLAFIDTERAIHVLGPDGAELAAINTGGDYAGYPTFNANGDLFYSTAVLPVDPDGFPVPSPGTIYHVAAPYTSEPVVVAKAPGLLVAAGPQPFLDADHLVAGYFEDEMWGQALIATNGDITRLEPWPNSYLSAVWPAE